MKKPQGRTKSSKATRARNIVNKAMKGIQDYKAT
jgi:hypothetical protein